VALKFCPERYGNHWYNKRQDNLHYDE